MVKNITFEEWEAERMKDPEFVKAAERLEPHYQLTVRVLDSKRFRWLRWPVHWLEPLLVPMLYG